MNVVLFAKTDRGIVPDPGFHHERAKGHEPTNGNRRHPSSPCPPLDNMGCPDPQ